VTRRERLADDKGRRTEVPGPVGTITAELPVVAGRGLVRPERTARPRRRPAPYLLRLIVWLLVFVLVCMLAAAGVEHYHPRWFDFLRNRVSTATGSGIAAGTTSARPGASTSPSGSSGPSSFRLVRTGAHGADYVVPAQSYAIVVTTDHPCWTQIAEPAGSTTFRYAQTVLASSSPKSFPVTGSSSVTVDAAATSIAVEIHGATVGTIHGPRLGYSYTFSPAGS
jgi:hypothetical protein